MKQKKIQKFSLFALSLIILVSNMTYASTYNKPITVVVNEKKIETDVTPQIKRDVAFVPISSIAKELNATIIWDKPFVTIIKDDIKLVFEIGKFSVLRNDEKYLLEEAPYLLEGRTMVPLRAISEQFGCSITYDHTNKCITIDSHAQIPFTPPVDTRRYYLSPDEKWGLAYKEDYSSDKQSSNGKIEITYLKNMETNDITEIFSGVGVMSSWLNDNQILFASKSGNDDAFTSTDPDRVYPCSRLMECYNLELYDVQTGQFSTIAEGIIFYKEVEDQGAIFYEFRNETGQMEYRQYDIATKQTLEITETQYEALLK